MSANKNLQYTKSHEWIEKVGNNVKIGLTDYAADELGDIVFVNLPEVGDEVTSGGAFGDIESVKAVSDVYSPVSGVIANINEELLDSPEKINEDAYAAWLVEVEDITDTEELMSADDYDAFIEAEKN